MEEAYITMPKGFKAAGVSAGMKCTDPANINKDDPIDHSVGIMLNKYVGDEVEEGDVLCTLYVNNVKEDFGVLDAFTIE